MRDSKEMAASAAAAVSSNQTARHSLTEALIRQDMMSDQQEKRLAASSSPESVVDSLHKQMGDTSEFEKVRERYLQFVQSVMHQEKEMNVRHGDLLVSRGSTEAGQTRSGKNQFVHVSESEFGAALLSDDAMQSLLSTMGHELTHVANGDLRPVSILFRIEHPAASREAEMLADLGGAGPLGTHNPQARIEYMKTKLRDLLPKMKEDLNILDENHLTDRDYKALSDSYYRSSSTHPAPWDRITALREEAVLMTQYEATHSAHSHSDREKESKKIIAQVMADMRGKVRMDPPSTASFKAASEAPHAVHEVGAPLPTPSGGDGVSLRNDRGIGNP